MTTPMTPDNDAPLYLARSLEQWWADFLSAECVDDMESACQMLFPYPQPMHFLQLAFGEACSFDNENTNFVCQALPCFGEAFAQKAVDAFLSLDERRQTRLVYCIAKTGRSSIPRLVAFLEHSSANVRMAACVGLADIIDPTEGGHPQEVLELQEDFLRKSSISKADVDAYNAGEDVLWDSPETKVAINAEVPDALLKRLEDDYRPIRLAAVATLLWLMQNCRIEVSIREGIVVALAKRLEDECQAVRIAAMNALAFETVPEGVLREEDVKLCKRQFDARDCEAVVEAMNEMAYNETMDCFRRLLLDPDPVIREKLAKVVGHCRTREGVRSLSQQDAVHLIRTVKEADPVSGSDLIARQEAVWALQWLSEQWEFPDEHEDNHETYSLKDEPVLPSSLLGMREKMGQLAQAPVWEVIAASCNRDCAVRLAALEALLNFSPTAEGVIDCVVNLLSDPCQQVRWRADHTLGEMTCRKISNWEDPGVDGHPVV